MSTIKQKIITIILAASMGNPFFVNKMDAAGNGHIVVAGTTTQVRTLVNDENFKRNVLPGIKGAIKISQKEKVAVISDVRKEIKLDRMNISFNYSQKFDNAEGPAGGPQTLQAAIDAAVKEKIKAISPIIELEYQKFKKHIKKQIEMEPDHVLTEGQMRSIFMNSLEGSVSVFSAVRGYACPMGGSHEKNKALSARRANEAHVYLDEVLRKELGTMLPRAMVQNMAFGSRLTPVGSIYDDPEGRVRYVIKKMKDAKLPGIDFDIINPLHKDFSKHLLAFDKGMETLRINNYPLYVQLRDYMAPLRRVEFDLEISIHAKVFGIDVKIEEKKGSPFMPLFMPEKKVMDVADHTFWKNMNRALTKEEIYAKKVTVPNIRRKNMPRGPKGGSAHGMYSR